jgi:acetate kinase
MRVLTVNAGSTSLKIVEVVDGAAAGTFSSLDDAFAVSTPDCVAHRVVHGGNRTAATRLDEGVITELHALTDLAPLHQPPALDAIERCRARWPSLEHVAGFDTAFHTTIPEAARTYALPARFRETVRVYGFHGLAHAWAVDRVARLAPEARRVVVAHLGGGQSLCAAMDGRSVMTTMGFTPLDGLVMATRSGALDPGAVLWLGRQTDRVDTVLEQESGLLGLCGTADMREVHERAAAGDGDARLAFDVWLHRVVTLLGGCVAALGGLDALAFSGGIGEHDATARRAIASALGWLGVQVDDGDTDRDHDPDHEVTRSGAAVRTFVVHAREDLQLAAEAERVLASPRRQRAE